MENYLTWLEAELNRSAEKCRAYSVYAGESPPDEMLDAYHALQEAWDGYQIIVEKDTSYRNSTASNHTDYKSFLDTIKMRNPAGYKKLYRKLPPELK